jgi:hypothetical protein
MHIFDFVLRLLGMGHRKPIATQTYNINFKGSSTTNEVVDATIVKATVKPITLLKIDFSLAADSGFLALLEDI